MPTDSPRKIDLILDHGAACLLLEGPQADGAATGADLRERANCSACDAVCCRLTVVLDAGDDVPDHLTTTLPAGLKVMAKNRDGWCVALNAARMNCGIYETRPAVCRRFVMNGPYCRAVRAEYALEAAAGDVA